MRNLLGDFWAASSCVHVCACLHNQAACERAAALCLFTHCAVLPYVLIFPPPICENHGAAMFCRANLFAFMYAGGAHELACVFLNVRNALTACACPSGVAMRRCSASSLMASISLWFAGSCTRTLARTHRITYSPQHRICTHTCAELTQNFYTLAVILLRSGRGPKKKDFLCGLSVAAAAHSLPVKKQ